MMWSGGRHACASRSARRATRSGCRPLTLDDVEWRAARLRIPQRKTRNSLWLPLTDEVGAAVHDYLRHGRAALAVRRKPLPFQVAPPRCYRELFLRHRTPIGVLKPTAITEVFQDRKSTRLN